MLKYEPKELAQILGGGLLSFPVTTFNEDLSFNEDRYRDHVSWMSSFDVAGLFVAGGTGEFFSLTNDEVRRTIRAAVSATDGKLPLLAPAGGSTANAIELVKLAEEEKADGILLFPPYLTESSQDGLVAHITEVAKHTKLGIIVYSRANGIIKADAAARLLETVPNFIGYKDGLGNLELMVRLYSKLGNEILYIGGLPTAETYALPYLELGVSTYSSAMFNFIPQFALDFYKDVLDRNRDSVYLKLNDFVLPYLAIRDKKAGYAVSIVKAGLEAVGRPAGPVRPPLTYLNPDELKELQALVTQATTLSVA